MDCMLKRQRIETVAIRFPKETWRQVRARAALRGETGLSWLSRCAVLCVRTANGEAVIPWVAAGMVEPVGGSGAEKKEARRVAPVAEEPDESTSAKHARFQGVINKIQGRPRRSAADAARWRGREGEDDQTRPEEE